MSGHNRWSQIQRQKNITDKKRGQIFSKLAKMITVAAEDGNNPETNSKLKTAIEKAREFNLPNENIERAIKKAGEKDRVELKTLLIESIGPGGIVLLIELVTDNKNRVVAEIKNILSENNFKMVSPGSLIWQFEQRGREFIPKNLIENDDQMKIRLKALLEKLDEHDDVEEIYSNVIL